MRKLVYYVAVTADGFIADADGDPSFFPVTAESFAALLQEYPETCPAHLRGPLGVADRPARHFDTVVMGRRTWEPALSVGLTSAYPHLDQYVLTHDRALVDDPTVTLVHEDPLALVRDLKSRPGLDIWLCGGGALAGQLLPEIDELHLKVNPVLIGAGVPLVAGRSGPVPLVLDSVRSLPDGVQLHVYTVGRSEDAAQTVASA